MRSIILYTFYSFSYRTAIIYTRREVHLLYTISTLWFFKKKIKKKLSALTRVYVRMLLHVGLLMKSFSAKLTWIWPCVRVDQQVCGQSGRPFERFAALFAFEQLFYVVRRPTTTEPPAKDHSRVQYDKIITKYISF